MGMFYRTIRLVENGIKPLYVFDGKPPQLKSGQLAKRLDRRNNATKNMEQAQELGNSLVFPPWPLIRKKRTAGGSGQIQQTNCQGYPTTQ